MGFTISIIITKRKATIKNAPYYDDYYYKHLDHDKDDLIEEIYLGKYFIISDYFGCSYPSRVYYIEMKLDDFNIILTNPALKPDDDDDDDDDYEYWTEKVKRAFENGHYVYIEAHR